MSGFDSIVIGGGSNGLSAATILARAGQSVLVVDRAAVPGGAATTGDIVPGYRCSRMAHLLRDTGGPELAELDPNKHGLAFARRAVPTVALTEDGRHVVIDGDAVRFADGAPHPEAEAWAALRARLIRFADKLSPLMRKAPIRLKGADLGQTATLAGLGFGIRRMGKRDSREFLRVLLSNAYDVLNDELSDPLLTGAIALDAVMGGHVGPRSPGTVLTLLYRMINGGGVHIPRGGMGAVSDAMAASAGAAGVVFRYGAEVRSIDIDGDHVSGIVLETGERIGAARVLSSLAPVVTARLTGPSPFDADLLRRMRNIRTKGCAAKVNLALSKAPYFKGLDNQLSGARLVVAPSQDAMERAFNRAKYGELPEAPILEITVPSLVDPTLVDGNGHVLSAIVQYVPHGLKTGWDDGARDALGRVVIDTLDRHAPGLSETIIGREIITPTDVEATTGAPGGHWHHGEMAADQMLMLRPALGIDQYALPVDGLFLCGASTHPGGDVTGIPGRNAARAVLDAAKTGRNAA
jgi:phytoene dehydrogenase-like protein